MTFPGAPHPSPVLRRPLLVGAASSPSARWPRPTRWPRCWQWQWWVLRAVRRDRLAAGGDRVDRDPPDLRAAGGGRPARRRHRPAAARLGVRVGLLHPGCMLVWPTPWHDDLRRRLSATVSAVAPVGRARWAGDPDEARRSRLSELGQLRRQFAATPYPPTGGAARRGRAGQAGGPGRVGGRQRAVGPRRGPRPWAPPVRTMIETVAETLRRAPRSSATGTRTRSRTRTDRAVRESSASWTHAHRPRDRRGGVQPDRRRARRTERTRPTDAPAQQGLASTSRERSRRRWTRPSTSGRLGIATAMVADATLEAAGVARGGRSAAGTPRLRRRPPVLAPAPLASVVPLGVVPQCPARCGRPGSGGGDRRGDRRRAWLLGGARHAVGAAVERDGHRGDGAPGRRRDGRGLPHRLGHHDRGVRRMRSCCGCFSRWRSWSRARRRR